MGISRKVSRKKTEAMLKLKQHMSNKASSVENISQETIDKSFDFLSKRYKLKLEQKMSKKARAMHTTVERCVAQKRFSYEKDKRICKIGISKNPFSRISAIYTDTGIRFRLCWVLNFDEKKLLHDKHLRGTELERLAQNCFADDWITREFYYLNPRKIKENIRWKNFLKNYEFEIIYKNYGIPKEVFVNFNRLQNLSDGWAKALYREEYNIKKRTKWIYLCVQTFRQVQLLNVAELRKTDKCASGKLAKEYRLQPTTKLK